MLSKLSLYSLNVAERSTTSCHQVKSPKNLNMHLVLMYLIVFPSEASQFLSHIYWQMRHAKQEFFNKTLPV